MVIIPGDISWAMSFEDALVDLERIAALPGEKVLVRGNHDYWWSSLNKMESALNGAFRIIQNNSIEYDSFVLCGSRGWMLYGDSTAQDQKIYDRELIRMNLSLQSVKADKPIIMVLHYPPFTPTAQGQTESAMTELFSRYRVEKVIYGHVHSGYEKFADREINGVEYILTSCDYLGFQPRLIGEY